MFKMEQFKKNIIAQEISKVLFSKKLNIITSNNWAGFADSKPSESIQKHDLPGLAVVTLFPLKLGEALFDVPVKQYKDVQGLKKKINSAKVLTWWLKMQKRDGMKMFGFCLTHTQVLAAEYGLRLIEELPGVSVAPHYDKFRLYFGEHYIDFSQAVALVYYLFSVYFGMIKPSVIAKNNGLELTLFMDRFPGASAGKLEIGKAVPKTDGKKFVEFLQIHSPTYKAIESDYKSKNVRIRLTTLDKWSRLGEKAVLAGKDHPHFILPDWMAVASISNEYREEFIASFPSYNNAVRFADSCKELYRTFKSFDIWELESQSLGYIVGGENQTAIPEEARSFIMDRAGR